MTATLNVNLTPCNKDIRPGETPEQHEARCPAKPVIIPCTIPPTFEVTVRLGECIDDGGEQGSAIPRACAPGDLHHQNCPARPIRVTCSISGKTWEESEVGVVEVRGMFTEDTAPPPMAALEACRARWPIIKALVTGRHVAIDLDGPDVKASLERQRNEEFSELATLAQIEQAAFKVQERAIKVMGEPTFIPDNFHRTDPISRPSASILARYVERLIKQVGAL